MIRWVLSLINEIQKFYDTNRNVVDREFKKIGCGEAVNWARFASCQRLFRQWQQSEYRKEWQKEKSDIGGA